MDAVKEGGIKSEDAGNALFDMAKTITK